MTNPDLVLVDDDCESERFSESTHSGYAVSRPLWDEYQRKRADLDDLVDRMREATWMSGWEFRGEPKPEVPEGIFNMAGLIPLLTPLTNPTPRANVSPPAY